MEVSPGTRGSAGHDVLHKCCKEGQSQWQGLSTGRPQWGPRVPAPRPHTHPRRPTPQPAKPTFIIDAAIGVFLPRHQFLHLIFSEPLSWPGGGRLSEHRGTGAKSGGPTEPLWTVGLPPTLHLGPAIPAHKTLVITPISETRRISDKSKGGTWGAGLVRPLSLGSVHNSASLVFKSPEHTVPFLTGDPWGVPSIKGRPGPPCHWKQFLREAF